MNDQPQEQCPTCDQLPAACKCDQPQECSCNKENLGMKQHSSICRAANRPPQGWTPAKVAHYFPGQILDTSGAVRLAHDINAAIAVERENAEANLKYWHKAEADLLDTQQQLAAEREKVEIADAANCSLLAFAAVVKGKPETPQGLKDLASKVLKRDNHGGYLMLQLQELRKQLADAREKTK